MQETVNKYIAKITEYWKSLEKKKKLGIIVTSVFSFLVITALIITLTRTKYEVLYSNLSLKDMGQITAKLDEMGVPWKSSDDQKSILVPADIKNRVKIELATYGLPKEGYTYMDAFEDMTWTMTDFDRKQRLKKAKESELASVISEIDGIHSAEVFIDEKDTTNFVLDSEDNKTTASVFIVKSDNRQISADKVKAIKHLVAGSINMKPEDVRVIDDEGRLLGEDNQDSIINQDLFLVKHSLENRINEGIKRFLENIVGYGNVDVMSSVKINMESEKTTILEFAPPIEGNEEGLIRSIEEVEEHMVGGTGGGVPGVDPNVEDYQTFDDTTSRYDRVSRIINNELNEINKEISKIPGQVESVTVAVLINSDALVDGEMTPEKEKEFVDLIYAATGLDTKNVQVKAEKFSTKGIDRIDDEPSVNWLVVGIIASILLLGLITLIIYLRIRAKKATEAELEKLMEEKNAIELEVADLDFEFEESKMKAQIDRFVERKPESVAQLLKNWLNE
ncbi:MAG: flagellar M-ring protein FliF [Tissierellia bacterium]|nr:flagellar M-ring protein FliF [Tissierellia bacterium]